MPDLPELDGTVAAAADQDLLVGVNEHSGALGYDHAVDEAIVSILADGAAVYLEGGIGVGDEGLPPILPARGTGTADGLGVEEAVLAVIGVVRIVVLDSAVRVAEADPLDGLVLGTEVDGVLLAGVGAGEYVANVVEAVDLGEADKCGGAPHGDYGVAGARYEEGAGAGGERVGGRGG